MYLFIVSSLASFIVGAVVENRPGKVGVEVPMAMTAAGEGEKEAATGVVGSGPWSSGETLPCCGRAAGDGEASGGG